MILGICGGTGSGKTTVVEKIISSLGEARIVCLQQDSYYRDLGEMPLDARNQVNFDHPDAYDSELLLSHLKALKAGKPVERPVYDFHTHSRKPDAVRVEPLPVVIVEGILILHDARMRQLMDVRVFVDCDADICFIRRLRRDLRERGRTVESVIEQYLTTVRNMHLQYVQPSRRFADIILPEGGFNEVGMDIIIGKIRAVLGI